MPIRKTILVMLSLLVLATPSLSGELTAELMKAQPKLSPYMAGVYRMAIEQASDRYKVDERLIMGVAITESHLNCWAKSCVGALGVMQVMPKWWNGKLRKAGIIICYRDYFDPVKGIWAGAYILSHYLQLNKGNVKEALTDYSGGASNYYQKVKMNGGF